MRRILHWLVVAAAALAISPAWSQEERSQGPILELESQVTGNREQPQVFHVVPWQTPDSPVPGYNPLGRQLDSVFGHLERDELQRSLEQSQEASDVDQ
ncbi:hypothetical protein [Marinimicrobium locisalis]|uniref:hypothetical protein n=1 Tax=Marinimicrobium locisalis TaxID=546022 RepID=UPI003221444A